ncbi:MAG: anti-sigma factor family protein [Bryobacteraceae bacterium]
MTCAEAEILLCDYVDGALAQSERADLEAHLSGCAVCAELARDARGALSVIERAAEVEPPPALLTRILDETRSGKHGRLGVSGGMPEWLRRWTAPILQPRLVMGMALTILSFSMMAKCAGVSPRQMSAADLEPARVWAALDNRVHRSWVRTVKFYESIRFVYEIQARLREWTDQQEEEDRNAAAQRPVDQRRLEGGQPSNAPNSQAGPQPAAPAASQPVASPQGGNK